MGLSLIVADEMGPVLTLDIVPDADFLPQENELPRLDVSGKFRAVPAQTEGLTVLVTIGDGLTVTVTFCEPPEQPPPDEDGVTTKVTTAGVVLLLLVTLTGMGLAVPLVALFMVALPDVTLPVHEIVLGVLGVTVKFIGWPLHVTVVVMPARAAPGLTFTVNTDVAPMQPAVEVGVMEYSCVPVTECEPSVLTRLSVSVVPVPECAPVTSVAAPKVQAKLLVALAVSGRLTAPQVVAVKVEVTTGNGFTVTKTDAALPTHDPKLTSAVGVTKY